MLEQEQAFTAVFQEVLDKMSTVELGFDHSSVFAGSFSHMDVVPPGTAGPFLSAAAADPDPDTGSGTDYMHLDQSGGGAQMSQSSGSSNDMKNNNNGTNTATVTISPEADISIEFDFTMQDSDDENGQASPLPSLIYDSDDDDDNDTPVFITRFPSPDSMSYGLDYNGDDDVDAMSNSSDDSMFSDLSDSFSLLRLDTRPPSSLAKAFRVTKTRARRAGLWWYECFKTRAEQDEHKAELTNTLRTPKSKSPKKDRWPKKDKTTRTPKIPVTSTIKTRPNGVTSMASALRTWSLRNTLPKTIEKALVKLATKPKQIPNNNKNDDDAKMGVPMDAIKDAIMDIIDAMDTMSSTTPHEHDHEMR